VNLELPFDEPKPSELDEQLARIDLELDALFLGEVEQSLDQLRAARSADVAA
jgi:hypothetical protein